MLYVHLYKYIWIEKGYFDEMRLDGLRYPDFDFGLSEFGVEFVSTQQLTVISLFPFLRLF